MVTQDAELMRRVANATCEALKVEKANRLAGSAKDKIALCEANSLQAGTLLNHIIKTYLKTL